VKMIYQDPGPLPPPRPIEQAEMMEIARLMDKAKQDGDELAGDLMRRATARFYADPVFHARVMTAAAVADREFSMRHPNPNQEVPTLELRMAAAVGLILAEEEP